MADRNDARYDALVRNDPMMQALTAEWNSLSTADPRRRELASRMYARMKDLGIPEHYKLQLSRGEGVKGVDHQNWFERNGGKLVKAGALGVFGLMGGNVLANVLGGGAAGAGAGAGAGGTTGAVTGVTSAAADIAGSQLSGGGKKTGVPDWLPSLLKVGAAVGIPAVANAASGNVGAKDRQRAQQYDSLINGIVPHLNTLAQLQASRAQAASPLYDQVLKMAMARMPNWSK